MLVCKLLRPATFSRLPTPLYHRIPSLYYRRFYMADNQEGPSKSALKKAAKAAEKARRQEEVKRKEEEARLARESQADAQDFAKANYGDIPSDTSALSAGTKKVTIDKINANLDNETVVFRARLHNTRAQGAKMLFLVLRNRDSTIQGLLSVDDTNVSKSMIKWADSLSKETIVYVRGVVQKPAEPIKSTSVTDAEVKILKLYIVSHVVKELPFQLDDAARPAADFENENEKFVKVDISTRLRNRVFDLRTNYNQSIFKLTSAVGNLFRSYLDNQGFIEIHSTKLQGAATESGASVFKLDYFKRDAFLAQSPQFAKQLCIAADMERVYEIGPVFRAENANTHRHLTEFTGLDLEMTIDEDYHEVVDVLDGMLLHIFRSLKERFGKEIATIRECFPAEEFLIPEKSVRLTYAQGIQLLREDGVEIGDYEDIDTPTEKRLGRLVREKYKTDYFLMDKFPLEIRPFYTMEDAENPKLSNSFDFYMRGEEILSGAQRVHEAPKLKQNLERLGIDPSAMADYLQGFEWGAPPHGGGGIGLERVVMLFLGIPNIRYVSLQPRHPRSFLTKGEEDEPTTNVDEQ